MLGFNVFDILILEIQVFFINSMIMMKFQSSIYLFSVVMKNVFIEYLDSLLIYRI